VSKIKRSLGALILVALFLVYLTACHGSFYFDNDNLIENIVKIELIYYHQTDVEYVTEFLRRRRHPDFDFDLVEYVGTMDVRYHELFLKELENVHFRNHMHHRNSPAGISVLMHEINGNLIIISGGYTARFTAEGRFIRYLGRYADSPSYEEFIQIHFFTVKNVEANGFGNKYEGGIQNNVEYKRSNTTKRRNREIRIR